MKIGSTAFDNGAAIPAKYTGVGDDVSPPLAWSSAPDGTKSFALICDDPDAPSRAKPRPEGPWVHWVLYNVPADATELSASIARQAEPAQPAGARQGKNDFGSDNVGYRGPMPPTGSGPHRYFFKIYALDQQLDLAPKEADKKSLLAAMQGHILAQGELMGTFERK
jgi:Raf kinase inhibitor-like YbhB/YbcL family protein